MESKIMICSYSKIKTDKDYNEDFKTYVTLGALQFLPSQLFWQIIRESVLYNHDLPVSAGEIQKIEFWPKWGDLRGIKVVDNSKYIEPDVFIRFADFDCIIEVKKTDLGGQHSDQWESQIQAYKNRYSDDKRLIYIAHGGNADLELLTRKNLREIVFKATWVRMFRVIKKIYNELSGIHEKTEAIHQELRILDSVIRALERCYGESEVGFLDELSSISSPISQFSLQSINQLWKI